jgi:5-methylcytosine-specific restriction protein A
MLSCIHARLQIKSSLSKALLIMPFASKTPCRSCKKPTHGPYCGACRDAGKAKDGRPGSTERGYGSKWQKAAAAYLKLHPIAVDIFKEHGQRVFGAEVVDHIIPHRGDKKLFWDSSNWQGLTKRDHDRKTAIEDGGWGRS